MGKTIAIKERRTITIPPSTTPTPITCIRTSRGWRVRLPDGVSADIDDGAKTERLDKSTANRIESGNGE